MQLRYAALMGLLLSFSASGATQVPSATELRNRYLQFRGGETALRDLKVVERSGTMRYFGPNGEELGTYHTCVEYTQSVAIQLDLTTLRLAERWTSSGGAQTCKAAFVDCERANADKTEELRSTALTANREILYSNEDWTNAQVVPEPSGTARISIGDSYYRFEINTGRLLEQGGPDRKRVYGDWRRIGEVVFPFYLADYYRNDPRYFIQLSAVIQAAKPTEWCARNTTQHRTAP